MTNPGRRRNHRNFRNPQPNSSTSDNSNLLRCQNVQSSENYEDSSDAATSSFVSEHFHPRNAHQENNEILCEEVGDQTEVKADGGVKNIANLIGWLTIWYMTLVSICSNGWLLK
ncbi:hypothetical protein BVRB_4g094610 [Beta vulgaris subsp. vulgaris]|nr:hypothetical protein BVRB_4g094610 [Beta vulgaris subsp. vulgaris]